MDFGVKISKTQVWIRNQHPWHTTSTNFQTKRTTLNFWAQICQKWILGSKIQKSKPGFGIRILEILGTPIFRQNRQLWIFGPKFAQKRILGSKFQKPKSGFGINILDILRVPIFRQNGQLWTFGPKFAKNGFWGQRFKNLSLDLESGSLKY